MWYSVLTVGALLVASSSAQLNSDRETMLGAKYYDGKKIQLPLDEGDSLQLLNHWIQQAVGGIFSAYTTHKINRDTHLNEHHKYRFEKCSKKASNVPKHARCVMNVIEAEKINEQTNEHTRALPLRSDGALLKTYKNREHQNEWSKPLSTLRQQLASPISLSNGMLRPLGRHYQNVDDEAVQVGASTDEHTFDSSERMRSTNDEVADREHRLTEKQIQSRHLFDKYHQRIHRTRTSDDHTDVSDRHADDDDDGKWVGKFLLARSKRRVNVVSRSKYKMLTEGTMRTPWGLAARIMKKTLNVIKHKKNSKSWYASLAEIKALGEQLKGQDAKKRATRRRIKEMGDAQEDNEAIDELRRFSGPVEVGIKDYSGIPLEIEEQLKSTVLEGRQKMVAGPIKLLRESIKLAMMLTGRNVTGFDNKTVRFASPKFFSIVPEEGNNNEVKILSPSLFSFHDDEQNPEQLFSVPAFMRAINIIKDGDHEDMLDFILEASGVSDALETAKREILKRNETVNTAKGIDGQPLYFTEKNVTDNYGEVEQRKIEVFNTLYANFTTEQESAMNATGFAPLTSEQLQLLYGTDSPYHSPDTLARLIKLSGDDEALHEILVNDIRLLSSATEFGLRPDNESVRAGGRRRRAITLAPIVLSPVILKPDVTSQPIVLSPLVLSPVILSPAVLGPFVLSPWVFVPLILSPRVLSPFVLNPFIGSPIILSPIVLHPFILSPGVLNPIILNPFVLSPIILSPLGLTPFALSPLLLSPIILNPMTMSPLVLSPLALSPIILSPQYIFALVLSPYFMSPIIASNLTMTAVILSPAILSS